MHNLFSLATLPLRQHTYSSSYVFTRACTKHHFHCTPVSWLQVASTNVVFSDSNKAEVSSQIASLDVEQLKVHVVSGPDATDAEVTAQEITVQDLSSGPLNDAKVVLARWQQPGRCNVPC